MNEIYYGQFDVEQTGASLLPIAVHSVCALIWVRADSASEAMRRAEYEIGKAGFRTSATIVQMQQAKVEDFSGKDIGTEAYFDALLNGHSLRFVGAAVDGVTTAGPLPVKHLQDTRVSDYFETLAEERTNGRCLHFSSGDRCSSIISAHSTQKSGLLSLIQEDEHVYALSFGLSVLKANQGLPNYERISVNKFSTFMGFCGRHDNELFRPIDVFPLVPTQEQVALYAYRSLCRELFVRENTLRCYKKFVENEKANETIRSFFDGYRLGTEIGYSHLRVHKELYDEMMSTGDYGRVSFVLFSSDKAPNAAFSGVLYPQFDFLGNTLQDLGTRTELLSLITFCSAPTPKGWGFLIAWMQENDAVCLRFIESIRTAIGQGAAIGDLLFRLMLCCENHAVSPKWWKSLDPKKKVELLQRFRKHVNGFAEIDNQILSKGAESLSGWEFHSVTEVVD